MRRTLQALHELRRYPSAVLGLAVIALLVLMSIYAVVAIPYSRAIELWRGGSGVWDDNPRNAQPAWVDLLSRDKLPRTIVVSTAGGGVKHVRRVDGRNVVEITLPFDYPYDRFPSEIKLFLNAATEAGTRTLYSVSWKYPDGKTVQLATNRSMRGNDEYYISQDMKLTSELGATPEVALFSGVKLAIPVRERTPTQGSYQLVVTAQVPEGADFNAKLVVYGTVHGLAGTDHRRRDLTVALLWGAPLALVFGLMAAVGSSLTTFVLAGIGTWFGGWVDNLFQRLTEVNMIIPMLPILIMMAQFYPWAKSIWVILGIVILLSIFGAGMKTYRAMFLQAKEAPYIEAAKAYGAGNFRIVFRYLLPRIVPVLLPTFVTIVPSFVFLEASLAVIGMGDPILPTWGKIINDAQMSDALYKGYYYWVLEPAILLMITGFAFSMVGYALDRVFNPRLRTV